jgi:hypothetical protein
MTIPHEQFHLDKAKQLKPSDQIMFRELDDESVLLNLHDESYYTLNSSGTIIWKELGNNQPLANAYQSFKKHYNLKDEQAKVDFNELVQEFVDKQFGKLKAFVVQDG